MTWPPGFRLELPEVKLKFFHEENLTEMFQVPPGLQGSTSNSHCHDQEAGPSHVLNSQSFIPPGFSLIFGCEDIIPKQTRMPPKTGLNPTLCCF